MKTIHEKKVIYMLLFLYSNSMLYGVICSILKTDMNLWSLTHYIVLALFYILCVSLFEKENINKNFFFLIFPLSFILIMLGYMISTSEFPSSVYLFILQIVVLFSLLLILHISIKVKANPKKHLDIIRTPTQLFRCMIGVTICLFAIVIMIILGSISRHKEFSNDKTFGIFCTMAIIFIIANYDKNYFFWKKKKKRIYLNFLLESSTLISGVGLYYYLNSVKYNDSNVYLFYIYIIPLISLIPFLVSAKKISKQYILYNK